MEIYNEKVRDLFDVNAGCGKTWKGLKVREDPAVGTFVEGLTVVSVISYDEVRAYTMHMYLVYYSVAE